MFDFLNMTTGEKLEAIKSGDPIALDILIDDPDPFVRGAIVVYGREKHVNQLIFDSAQPVQVMIAMERKEEKYLDILVDSQDWFVKRIVALSGIDKYLDILVHDESWEVREAVAGQHRAQDLDILVHDESPFVREIVAKYGRDKDVGILIQDKHWRVYSTAMNQWLKRENLTKNS